MFKDKTLITYDSKFYTIQIYKLTICYIIQAICVIYAYIFCLNKISISNSSSIIANIENIINILTQAISNKSTLDNDNKSYIYQIIVCMFIVAICKYYTNKVIDNFVVYIKKISTEQLYYQIQYILFVDQVDKKDAINTLKTQFNNYINLNITILQQICTCIYIIIKIILCILFLIFIYEKNTASDLTSFILFIVYNILSAIIFLYIHKTPVINQQYNINILKHNRFHHRSNFSIEHDNITRTNIIHNNNIIFNILSVLQIILLYACNISGIELLISYVIFYNINIYFLQFYFNIQALKVYNIKLMEKGDMKIIDNIIITIDNSKYSYILLDKDISKFNVYKYEDVQSNIITYIDINEDIDLTIEDIISLYNSTITIDEIMSYLIKNNLYYNLTLNTYLSDKRLLPIYKQKIMQCIYENIRHHNIVNVSKIIPNNNCYQLMEAKC